MKGFSCKEEKWYFGDEKINGYKSIIENNNIIYQGELCVKKVGYCKKLKNIFFLVIEVIDYFSFL